MFYADGQFLPQFVFSYLQQSNFVIFFLKHVQFTGKLIHSSVVT